MPNTHSSLDSLLQAISALAAALLTTPDDEQATKVATRLRASVVRPLRDALASASPGPSVPNQAEAERSITPGDAATHKPRALGELSEELWPLARIATELRVQSPNRPDLQEAAAALQDLAVTLADGSAAPGRIAELQALQSELGQQIEVARNGPYLVANARRLEDWLGRPLPVRPQLALCRCGHSGTKPSATAPTPRSGLPTPKTPTESRTDEIPASDGR